MRTLAIALSSFLAIPLSAQNWYVPNNQATTGSCNQVPFGGTPASGFDNAKYQTRCTVADLGGVPGLITGLAFAACTSGPAHYAQLQIVLDHIPPAQPLSTTFASNLTPAAVVVLDAPNYTWHLTANAWNEVGLQTSFAWNGVDDLLVQVTTVGGTAPGGVRRDVRQRIAWNAATGAPPAVGTSALVADKVEVSMRTAHTSTHGVGCAGSNGTPRLGFAGLPQLASTFSIQLQNGVASGIGVLIAGTTNGLPFPLELGFLGMPSCFAFTDIAVTAVVVLDGTGAGAFPFQIAAGAPAGFRFYAQFACLDLAANPLGFTTSTYGRALVGN